MAVTNEQILGFLTANPDLTDAQIVAAMEQYGVSPAQMAQAVGIPEGEVASRVAATVPPGQTVTLGDTIVQPQYSVTGSGEDQQIGVRRRLGLRPGPHHRARAVIDESAGAGGRGQGAANLEFPVGAAAGPVVDERATATIVAELDGRALAQRLGRVGVGQGVDIERALEKPVAREGIRAIQCRGTTGKADPVGSRNDAVEGEKP